MTSANLPICQFPFRALAFAIAASACIAPSGQSQTTSSACAQVGRPLFLPAVPEASGVAHAGGALWTHNDSDGPVLYRLDGVGRPTPVAVPGADVRDWEDLVSAPCDAGTCLYIADIGDNRGSRQRITIYEVPVPAPGSTSTEPAVAMHARFPDGPRDAEALLVTKGAGTFIITKESRPRVYVFAAPQNPGEVGMLTFVRTLKEKLRITGAAASSDGRWVALRSNGTLLLYTHDEFVNGGNAVRVDLTPFEEPQGEGVAFGSAGEIYLVSEGGGSGAPGMLTRVHCAIIR